MKFSALVEWFCAGGISQNNQFIAVCSVISPCSWSAPCPSRKSAWNSISIYLDDSLPNTIAPYTKGRWSKCLSFASFTCELYREILLWHWCESSQKSYNSGRQKLNLDCNWLAEKTSHCVTKKAMFLKVFFRFTFNEGTHHANQETRPAKEGSLEEVHIEIWATNRLRKL